MSQPVLVLTLATVFGAAVAGMIARFASANGRATRAVVLVAVTTAVVAVVFATFGGGLRINFTPSMPRSPLRPANTLFSKSRWR